MQQAVITLPVVEYIELLLNVIAPPFTIYFLILLRRPFFHLNLRVLLANFSYGLMVLTSTRIFILMNKIFKFMSHEVESGFNLTHDACVLSIMNASFLIAGERFIATWLVDKYEKTGKCWLALFACVVMWLINICLSYVVHTSILTDSYHIPVPAIFFGTLVLNSIGVVGFVLINRHNKKCWKRDLQKNLAHRYQIMENVRTSRELSIALFVDFIISVYLFVVVILRVLYKDRLVSHVLTQTFDIISATMTILMPILFIRTHPRLRYVARHHFCRGTAQKWVRNRHQKAQSIQPAEAIARDEGNVYFCELAKSWDQALKK